MKDPQNPSARTWELPLNLSLFECLASKAETTSPIYSYHKVFNLHLILITKIINTSSKTVNLLFFLKGK